MEILKLYQLYQWDGGEREVPKSVYFKTRAECDQYLEGRKHDRFREETLHIFESAAEYKESKSQSLKASALAKLSDLEKLALGIKES
jgi:hypothetical protein